MSYRAVAKPITGNSILKDEYKDGRDENDKKLFDTDILRFAQGKKLSHIGGKVTAIDYGTTTYNLNNNKSDTNGANIDLILGGNALITVSYNPTYTHQKGVVWYAPLNPSYVNFQAMNGPDKSQCSVFGREATITNGKMDKQILRAVSIYDPWFDKMAVSYAASSTNRTEDEWRSKYYAMSNAEHLDPKNKEWFRYPTEDELTKGFFKVLCIFLFCKFLYHTESLTYVISNALHFLIS